MEQALARSGIRTHSILVDITNYVLTRAWVNRCMPLIWRKILKVRSVRQAQPQEKLTLLNEQEVELQDDIMVVADDQKYWQLRASWAGLSSVTDETTQDIFLESAFFAPLAIAGRARRFGLHTDSSQRYERGVDFELPMIADASCFLLIQAFAGGEFGPITVAEQEVFAKT